MFQNGKAALLADQEKYAAQQKKRMKERKRRSAKLLLKLKLHLLDQNS